MYKFSNDELYKNFYGVRDVDSFDILVSPYYGTPCYYGVVLLYHCPLCTKCTFFRHPYLVVRGEVITCTYNWLNRDKLRKMQ